MVLNCVPVPEQRGDAICRLFQFLRPGGLCFVTLPRSCLQLSPYTDKDKFVQALRAVGFTMVHEETKETPKVAFFVCQRPPLPASTTAPAGGRSATTCAANAATARDCTVTGQHSWTQAKKIRRGKKYRNDFCITFRRDCPLLVLPTA